MKSTGLLDIQTCRMGLPILISFPHYLYADPTLLSEVKGVVPPDEERDMFHIDLVPVS